MQDRLRDQQLFQTETYKWLVLQLTSQQQNQKNGLHNLGTYVKCWIQLASKICYFKSIFIISILTYFYTKFTFRIMTFSTLKNAEVEDKDSDDEEGQRFYAGGSITSGQQVIGPPRNNADVITDMFQTAQK